MGLTTALNTSLNGLALNETTIDVLGNNIANAGTNGFKASNVLFMTQLARTFAVGSAPTSDNGGTNPRQIGLGATTAAITRDFTQGGITNSTSPSDLAIQGDGFFVMDGSDGRVYTRNGNFQLNSQNLLTNASGLRVQGYAVDDSFNLITTQLVDIEIRLGQLNVAQQTQNVQFGGALLASDDADTGTRGTMVRSEALFDALTSAEITDATLLVDVQNAGGANLFTAGETLSFAPMKGGRRLDAQSLAVDGATILDMRNLISNTLGIQSGGSVPLDESGQPPGVTVTAAGEIQILGNMGEKSEINVNLGDLTSNGSNVNLDLAATKVQQANGEGAFGNFVVFDSLGQRVDLKMTTVLESRNNNSTTYRYFLESVADSRDSIAVGTGTIAFDSEGKVISGGTAGVSIERGNTAANNMQITLDFNKISGILSPQAQSSLIMVSQDGSDPGTLTNFVIDDRGVINGVFDNGIIRTLGQVVLARFANPQGLVESGSNTFMEGVSSGPPAVVNPGTQGAGTLRAGAIEVSNTDIGRNLVDLIVASTNYRGNARVISSVQQLVDELLVLGR